jgi:HEAT repeat protein
MNIRAKMVLMSLALIVGFTEVSSRAAEPDDKAIQKLVKQLSSDSFAERSDAYRQLVWIGPASLPRMREAEKSDVLDVSRVASRGVKEIESVWHTEYLGAHWKKIEGREMTLAEVLQASQDERPYMRHASAFLLYQWHSEPEALVAGLRLMRDEHVLVRRAAANCGGCFVCHEPYEKAVSALIAALKDEDRMTTRGQGSVAVLAASSLGSIQRPTREVLDALIESATTGEEDDVRGIAMRSLAQLATRDESVVPEVVKVLVASLKGKDFVKEPGGFGLRAYAADALSRMKTRAQAAVPELIEALRAEGAEDARTASLIRGNVLRALEEIGPAADAAVPHLLKILRSDELSESEFRTAVSALKRISPRWKYSEFSRQ